jgi:hypothetical protein
MSSDLLSGCLQNQIQLLALEIGKNIGFWVGLGWVCISEVQNKFFPANFYFFGILEKGNLSEQKKFGEKKIYFAKKFLLTYQRRFFVYDRTVENFQIIENSLNF